VAHQRVVARARALQPDHRPGEREQRDRGDADEPEHDPVEPRAPEREQRVADGMQHRRHHGAHADEQPRQLEHPHVGEGRCEEQRGERRERHQLARDVPLRAA
jgi:hypothetical protein